MLDILIKYKETRSFTWSVFLSNLSITKSAYSLPIYILQIFNWYMGLIVSFRNTLEVRKQYLNISFITARNSNYGKVMFHRRLSVHGGEG